MFDELICYVSVADISIEVAFFALAGMDPIASENYADCCYRRFYSVKACIFSDIGLSLPRRHGNYSDNKNISNLSWKAGNITEPNIYSDNNDSGKQV